MSASRTWPRGPLDRVPPLREAVHLADAVRRATYRTTRPQRVALDRVARAGGFDIREASLSSATGGTEAMLIPLDGDGFAIRVDPEPRGGWPDLAPDLRAEVSRHRLRFRAAHELCHSFFYVRSSGATPRRHLHDSAAQERFCDEFARCLLVPPAFARSLPAEPRSVFELQSRFDVSLQVAARSLAAAHGPRMALAVWYWRPDRRGRVVPRLQWSHRAARVWSSDCADRIAGMAHAGRASGGGLVCDAARRQAVAVAAAA